MITEQGAKKLALAGMFLQIATAVGVAMSMVGIFRTLDSIGATDAIQSSAAKISEGVSLANFATSVATPLGFLGLVLLAVAINSGTLYRRWVYRWSCLCMFPWVLTIGFGTLVGLTGLILLFTNRARFDQA